MLLLAAIDLIAVLTLDGRTVLINPAAVIQLVETRPEGAHGKQFTDKVRCVIGLPDNKYVTVAEACGEIRKLFEGKQEE